MNRTLLNAIVFILISLFIPVFTQSAELVINSDGQFEFAKQYMDKGEFQKAIVEFERMIYFFPDDENIPMACFLIGICHLELKEYKSARDSFIDIYNNSPDSILGEKALFLIGESYYRQGLSDEATHYFKKAFKDYPQSELKDMALYRLGWNNLMAGKWGDASEIFNMVEKDSFLYTNSIDLAEKSLKGDTLLFKNPKTAGIMAGIIPGLGHAYCNRYRDGTTAFFLNGIFIWAAAESFEKDHDALGGILTLLEAGWYAGNIYSAVNCAHKHNRKIKNDFIKSLPDNLNLNIFTTGQKNLGIGLSIDF